MKNNRAGATTDLLYRTGNGPYPRVHSYISYMKIRDIIKRMEKDGWTIRPRTGAIHRQYVHPVKKGRVTIAGRPGVDADPGTLKSTLRQAGLK